MELKPILWIIVQHHIKFHQDVKVEEQNRENGETQFDINH